MPDPDRSPPPDLAWRNFRTVAVGCPVGWLLAAALFVALTSGRLVNPDPGPLATVMAAATAFYAMLPALLYPWERRREGTRSVRGVVAVAYVAGFAAAVLLLQVAGLQRVRSV